MTTSINGLIGTYPAVNPIFTGGYVYSQEAVPGVVAANNFMTLANPTGSGKVILVAGVFISSTTTGAVSVTEALRGYLATGISGGTLVSNTAIAKIRSTMPPPAAEVRVGNPAATVGAAWFNSPTLQATGSSTSSFIHQVPATIAAGSLTLLPGEGTVIRTLIGSIATLWNISIAWSEI